MLIKKAHQIRVVIAGHDKNLFVRIPTEGTPEITVERNTVYASCIDLPTVRGKSGIQMVKISEKAQ